MHCKKIYFLHGTKSPPESKQMIQLKELFEEKGFSVYCPKFPPEYKKNSEENDLTYCLADSMSERLPEEEFYLAGKSLGAKVAVEIVNRHKIRHLYLFGFPFTNKKGEIIQHRIDALNKVQSRTTIIQGTEDRYGSRKSLSLISLNSSINIAWIEDVDHNFRKIGGPEISKETLRRILAFLTK